MNIKNTLYLLLFCISFALQAQEIPKKADKFFQEARVAFIGDNSDAALELLDKAIKVYPKYTEAVALKAKIYSDTEQWEKARESYLKIKELSPSETWKVYFQLGNLEMQQHNYEAAKVEYKNCLAEAKTPERSKRNAQRKIEICDFRIKAMKNPVPFEPITMGDSINSILDEYLPAFTVDGEQIYFTRRIGEGANADEDFYRSTKVEGIWSKAQDVGQPINSIESPEGALSISPDGKRLFFASNKVDRTGGFDLYYSYQVENEWLLPTTLHKPINSRHWESQPSISADGKSLYFASKRPGGFGGIDIWVSHLVDNTWQEPENLGKEVNTEEDEQCPFMHPDGMTLYFSSKGHLGMGDADIFKATRQPDGTWKNVENIGYPINTHENENSMIVSAEGNKGYYARYVEGNGFDLFSFELPKAAQPMFVTYVKGKVYDAETKNPINAQVQIIEVATGTVLNTLKADKTKGDFLLTLPSGKNYAFNVSKDDYLFYSDHFSLKESNNKEPYLLDIALQPIKVGESMVLKNIFFETGKFELKSTSFIELDKLVNLLKENPTLKMEVVGHTDNVGDDTANLKLSENRAKSVYDYVSNKGIDKSRLSYKGKGESQPIDSNDAETGRAANRRTELLFK